MVYNPKYNASNYQYRKTHMKRAVIDFPNAYYENVLKIAVEASGQTLSGFIKQAVNDRICSEGGTAAEALRALNTPSDNAQE